MVSNTPYRNNSGNQSSEGRAPYPDEMLFPESSGIDPKKKLQDVFGMLWRGKWYIVGFCCLALAAAATLFMLGDPEYESQALVMVSTQKPSAARADDASSFGFIDDAPQGERTLFNQELIMQQSLHILERTAEKLREQEVIPGTDTPIPILQRVAGNDTRSVEYLLGKQYISVLRAGEDVDAIQITAKSSMPAEAALIANTFAETYIERTQETSRERISTSRKFIEEQLAEQTEKLNRAENELEEYMRTNSASALDEEAVGTVEQVANLEAALDAERINAQTKRAAIQELESELDRLAPRLTERMASGVEEEIKQAQDEVALLELKIEQIYSVNPELRQDPSGSAPLQRLLTRVESLRERVNSLSEQYVSELMASGGIDLKDNNSYGRNYLADLNRQLAQERLALSGSEAQIEAIQQRLAEYRQKLRSIPEVSIRLAQLKRERASTEALHNNLKAKLQEASIAEESEIGLARLLRPALIPREPVWPLSQFMMIGLMIGLLGGIGTAYARHRLDSRVYTPDDVRTEGYQLLSVTPDLRRVVKKEFDSEDQVDVDGRLVSTSLMPIVLPESAAAESYRRLYVSLPYAHQDGRRVKTILVTSAEEGAGKSTTSVNLAATAAQLGMRTLLVDADLRRPTIHTKLDFTSPLTLRDLANEPQGLTATEPFRVALSTLHAVTSHEFGPSPAQLLTSASMRRLIEQFRETFDLVIFDSPPVLPTADASLLAPHCDATIVVAAAGSTDKDALNQTMSELQNAGAHLAGAVLSRFDPSGMVGYKHTYNYRFQNYEYAAG